MQKTLFSLLIAFVLSVPLFADKQKTKKEILKQLNLVEGQYDVVVPKDKASSFCEDEILDIELHEDKEGVSLMIGAQLIFPQINASQASYESNVDCKTTQTNKLEDKKLTISQTEKCGKKSEETVFQIDFTDGLIGLSRKEGSEVTYCRYKKSKSHPKGK